MTGSDEVHWSAEYTEAEKFEELDKQDAYKQIKVTRYNRIAMKIPELDGAMSTFVESHLPSGFAELMDAAWDPSADTSTSVDRTVFTYDKINYTDINTIPRLSRATVFRSPDDSAESMEDTFYHYADDKALRPDSQRTVTVLNPERKLQGGLWTYVPKDTDVTTTEDAALSYDSRLRLNRSQVTRISPEGGKTKEDTLFYYDLAGRVGVTDKKITKAGVVTREISP